MTTFEAVVLGIVEGLTEFLPVSSTGHMILTQAALQIQESSFVKVFLINIQFGAILAVLVTYFRRFFQSLDFYKTLIVAFLPAMVFGFTLNKFIDSLLESVPVVAVMLILGGIIMIWIDKHFQDALIPEEEEIHIDEDGHETVIYPPLPTYKQALIIGLSQCIAMIPGVSRSAATIIGGLTQKMSFKNAAEFSFFLAVPTISAAALYKTYAGFKSIKGVHVEQLIYGNITSFIVALIAIQFFLAFLNKFGLKYFGYYRIVLGLIILIGIYVFHLPFQILK